MPRSRQNWLKSLDTKFLPLSVQIEDGTPCSQKNFQQTHNGWSCREVLWSLHNYKSGKSIINDYSEPLYSKLSSLSELHGDDGTNSNGSGLCLILCIIHALQVDKNISMSLYILGQNIQVEALSLVLTIHMCQATRILPHSCSIVRARPAITDYRKDAILADDLIK